ncbi:unnamed protein product [Aspergillus oryzae]|uniref:Unnamed protein product n=2 Tax=Aspergillus oryzae TaxID=5062 RepID=A0AAN4YJ50_ASPOZ|nr:unnamed protein product [Aspergillus oryzae]GMF88067.1 unnamed protein product [Aspergillus oryzae]GMG05290.1 unnamed protein product [Aspergillus oryzae]GMG28547.1 unnamed protein product [Aspergillus oryzae]GMG45689.1 unnamed protein product [Aspergillus oryzae var. brunneus]
MEEATSVDSPRQTRKIAFKTLNSDGRSPVSLVGGGGAHPLRGLLDHQKDFSPGRLRLSSQSDPLSLALSHPDPRHPPKLMTAALPP